MKRLWTALGLLLLLLTVTLANTRVLEHRVRMLVEPLQSAQRLAEAGDRAAAVLLTRAAQAQWDQWAPYFHIILRHNNTDEVEIAFHEALSYARSGENGGEYATANAVLIAKIELLYEMEQLDWKNLL